MVAGEDAVSLLVAETIWSEIQSTHSVNEDQLSILHILFGKNLERATRIVDERGVKKISGEPSGRFVFQVSHTTQHNHIIVKNCFFFFVFFGGDHRMQVIGGESTRKEEYLCFPQHYCACYSFFYDVVNRGQQLCCKHQLAARFADSLGTCVDLKVSDDQLAHLLAKL
ncbi:hypothetical protein R6Q59_019399 [Mikania micrantha]